MAYPDQLSDDHSLSSHLSLLGLSAALAPAKRNKNFFLNRLNLVDFNDFSNFFTFQRFFQSNSKIYLIPAVSLIPFIIGHCCSYRKRCVFRVLFTVSNAKCVKRKVTLVLSYSKICSNFRNSEPSCSKKRIPIEKLNE